MLPRGSICGKMKGDIGRDLREELRYRVHGFERIAKARHDEGRDLEVAGRPCRADEIEDGGAIAPELVTVSIGRPTLEVDISRVGQGEDCARRLLSDAAIRDEDIAQALSPSQAHGRQNELDMYQRF